ncbi:MAG: hypothetical protein K6L80_11690 [Agarilytica sp.]
MKELNDLIGLVTQDNIKKGAGIGAAVGAAIGATAGGEGKTLKNAAVGAGLGAAIMWALDQYQFDPPKKQGANSDGSAEEGTDGGPESNQHSPVATK